MVVGNDFEIPTLSRSRLRRVRFQFLIGAVLVPSVLRLGEQMHLLMQTLSLMARLMLMLMWMMFFFFLFCFSSCSSCGCSCGCRRSSCSSQAITFSNSFGEVMEVEIFKFQIFCCFKIRILV